MPDSRPWIYARFDGDCDGCDAPMLEGDHIRSDGDGGWLCAPCGEDDEWLAGLEGDGDA